MSAQALHGVSLQIKHCDHCNSQVQKFGHKASGGDIDKPLGDEGDRPGAKLGGDEERDWKITERFLELNQKLEECGEYCR